MSMRLRDMLPVEEALEPGLLPVITKYNYELFALKQFIQKKVKIL